ncbi:MAG: cysteine synthase A [Clostridia bacterium]|nr:cysteine synthase A [Clostridia bacterium]
MIYKNITELIGKTPMVELSAFSRSRGLETPILAKVERFNPAGSVKDRVGYEMIRRAEAEGRLCPGSVIIEPTSGNTGIGLCACAAVLGYKVIIVMPDTMSVERRKLIAAYGAEIVLTDGALGMKGAIAKAEELSKLYEGSVVAGQFVNPANPDAHYRTTGPEIWEDTNGNIDVFVAGAGTGGTVTGVGRYLKEKDPNIRIIAVEPASSPFLSRGEGGPHGLQGIGAGFVPDILDLSVVDEIVTVTEEEAYDAGRALARLEGLLVGITSGAAAYAAASAALREELRGKRVVALLPDTGERYLSTPLFE